MLREDYSDLDAVVSITVDTFNGMPVTIRRVLASFPRHHDRSRGEYTFRLPAASWHKIEVEVNKWAKR